MAKKEETIGYNDWMHQAGSAPKSTREVNGVEIDKEVYHLMVSNLKGIYGLPYQFLPTVDRRIDIGNDSVTMGSVSSLGRKYSEKIISRMPIMFLTPGYPGFLSGFNKTDKGILLQAFLDKNSDDPTDIISQSGKFYSFKFAYAEYFRYVNSLLNAVAVLLGIGDEKIPDGTGKDTKLSTFDWSKGLNDDFHYYFNSKESIPFYLDSENSISESFSNDTTESSLASKVNDKAAETREYRYLLNGLSGWDMSSIADSIGNLANSIGQFGDVHVFQAIGAGLDTIASGGKLIFPKMWSDSDFSRSYSLSFKFRSPDHDTLSIYLNLIVPYFHLIAMAAPHQSGSINGLDAPFLVRAFYKGFFNCDMGIIRELSCTKGGECQWNVQGLPTSMDVQVTIEDLYSNLTISNAYGGLEEGLLKQAFSKTSVANFIKNTNLIDYLSMTAAVNLNEPEIDRMAKLAITLMGNKFINAPDRLFLKWEQQISSLSLSFNSSL